MCFLNLDKYYYRHHYHHLHHHLYHHLNHHLHHHLHHLDTQPVTSRSWVELTCSKCLF